MAPLKEKMKLGLFIPCYNVAKDIPLVLTAIGDAPCLERIHTVLAIDNHSQDATVECLLSFGSKIPRLKDKLIVLKNAVNYGLGGSQKIAFQYFLDKNFTHVIIVHGDNQGNAKEIATQFLKTYDKNPSVDLIIASRFMSQSDISGYNRLRTLGNHCFNFLTWVLTGHWMSDSGAGIIFIKTEALRHIPFGDLTNGFHFNPQLNILLYSHPGIHIKEIPLIWKDSQDKPAIWSLKYCLELLKILFHYRWRLFNRVSEKFKPISTQAK